MNYAHIRAGVVVQYLDAIPFIFYGVSRFRSLSPQDQAAHGVLPVVDVTPAYDPAIYRQDGIASSTVMADRVEIVYRLRRAGGDAKAIESGGQARMERRVRRLVTTDPVEALLIKGGLK